MGANSLPLRVGSVAILVSVLLLGTPACTAGADQSPVGLKHSKMAPDFTINDVNGAPVKLSALRGRPVMLNFWSISCPPCRYEMPEIEAVYQKFRGQAAFIGISPVDPPAEVREFVRVRGYSWTFVTDPAGTVSYDYGIMYFPTTYFLDAGGRGSSVIIGGPVS
ncbi:MAG: TlpA family protein disulfide reductase, partial [Dehalococcoidia bacterium]|nr:TlpA family protein disulfide reductase [Dehalococcoidia bacterium]